MFCILQDDDLERYIYLEIKMTSLGKTCAAKVPAVGHRRQRCVAARAAAQDPLLLRVARGEGRLFNGIS